MRALDASKKAMEERKVDSILDKVPESQQALPQTPEWLLADGADFFRAVSLHKPPHQVATATAPMADY